MKNKQKLTDEEALVQIFATSYKSIFDNTKNFIKLYEYKYKMLQQEIIEHEENEPLKIFKKTHKIWETKKEQLNIELEEAFNNLMKEYTYFEDLIEFS